MSLPRALALIASYALIASLGIGVASLSRLTWDLPPAAGFTAFRAYFAAAGNLPYADVTVRVKLDGDRYPFRMATGRTADGAGHRTTGESEDT